MHFPFVKKEYLKPVFKYFVLSGLGFFTFLILFIGSIYFGFFGKIPTKSGISDIRYNKSTAVYDVNETLIGSFFHHYRYPVSYEQLPKHLVDALVATEDARFYEHNGIDYRSLLRVFVKTFLLGDKSAGGGSTISQQLAKNLFPREQSGTFNLLVSKVKEVIIAVRLEDVYSKNEIITIYLNTVPFSENVYGIQTASRTFFSKNVSELNLQEAACLVGTLKATYTYNPRIFPDRSRSRRNVVLSQMVKFGNLPEDSALVASNAPLVLDFQPINHHAGLAPYFREQVRKELGEWVKKNPKDDGTLYNIYRDGLSIYTTLDANMQRMAESALQTHMAALQKSFENNWGSKAPWNGNRSLLENVIRRSQPYQKLKAAGLDEQHIMDSLNVKKSMRLFSWEGGQEVKASTIDSLKHYLKFLQAGFLAMDPQTGAVRTWIGGIDHQWFQFDHVSQSRRQVGSTFKPILYATALEQGMDPCRHLSARQVTYSNMEGWTPANGEEDYSGLNFSMQAALSKSINTVSIKILEQTGLKTLISQARRMNIQSELPEVPSLALGTAELSMLELAGAYASFVNEARPVKPYIISKITDNKGNILAEFEPEDMEQAFSEVTQEIMLELLQSVVNEGTASRIRWKYGLKNDIGGKTGTTQSNRDGWFVGVTPKLVTVSWVGADDPNIRFKDTSVGQGANSALPLFALFMQMLNKEAAYADITQANFPGPSERTKERLDCKPMKEDGFLKKLFTNSEEPQERDFRNKNEKRGWLKSMFRKN